MSRRPEARIADIILCCEKILDYTAGIADQGQLAGEQLVLDAVLRNLEIIGEAAKHVLEGVRARIPGIEWKKIVGMRDWLSHVYFRVDIEVVWDAVRNKVPPLLAAVRGFDSQRQDPGDDAGG